jgi:hypothetical protein
VYISIEQAIDIWCELESASLGNNSYGGDEAEIYAYRLMPHSPGSSQVLQSGKDHILFKDMVKTWRKAAESLVWLCDLFMEKYEDYEITIDGYGPADWFNLLSEDNNFAHRCRVKVVEKEGDDAGDQVDG